MSYLAHVTDLVATEDEPLSADDDSVVLMEEETGTPPTLAPDDARGGG